MTWFLNGQSERGLVHLALGDIVRIAEGQAGKILEGRVRVRWRDAGWNLEKGHQDCLVIGGHWAAD